VLKKTYREKAYCTRLSNFKAPHFYTVNRQAWAQLIDKQRGNAATRLTLVCYFHSQKNK